MDGGRACRLTWPMFSVSPVMRVSMMWWVGHYYQRSFQRAVLCSQSSTRYWHFCAAPGDCGSTEFRKRPFRSSSCVLNRNGHLHASPFARPAALCIRRQELFLLEPSNAARLLFGLISIVYSWILSSSFIFMDDIVLPITIKPTNLTFISHASLQPSRPGLRLSQVSFRGCHAVCLS